MDTTQTTLPRDPRDVFLNAQDVINRYRWKRSAGYERLKLPGFPHSLPGGVWRLDTLIAWEDGLLAGLDFETPNGPVPDIAPTPPRAAPPKRNGARKTATDGEAL